MPGQIPELWNKTAWFKNPGPPLLCMEYWAT